MLESDLIYINQASLEIDTLLPSCAIMQTT